MNLGISNIAWSPDELDDVLAVMANAGARGLEIAPGLAFADEADAFVPSEAAVAAFRRRIAAHGIELISMQSLLFGVEKAKLFGDEAERGGFIHGIGRAIGLAERLGIGNLVMGSPGARKIPDTMPRQDAETSAIDIFRRLGDLAAAAGTKIALEPNPAVYGTNFMNTLREAADFAARVDHPAVTVNFDLGALHMNDEIADADALFVLASPRVSHVHVSEPDLAPAPRDAQTFATVAKALLERGYAGWFSIEMRAVDDDRLGVIESRLEACARALSGVGAATS